MDNYNTKASEHLHINYAKNAFEATNKKDEYLRQMTLWLERCEKVYSFSSYIDWHQNGHTIPTVKFQERPRVSLAKTPNACAVSFDTLVQEYSVVSFKKTLQSYLTEWYNQMMASHIQPGSVNISESNQGVDVWWRIKFCNANLRLPSAKQSEDAVHAEPKRATQSSKTIPARFDTALIQHSEGPRSGLRGQSFSTCCIQA